MILKSTRTAALTVGALDTLWGQEGTCCPYCCGLCWVLRDMHNRGDLDSIVRLAPERMVVGSGWWNEEGRHVDRFWLTSKWMDSTCTHGVEDESDEPGAEAEPEPAA